MNKPFENFYKITDVDVYKQTRIYDESSTDASGILPVEMFYFFNNALKHNNKIYMFTCIPNHQIIISEQDKKILNTILEFQSDNPFEENYEFDTNTLTIKEYQHSDLSLIFDLAYKEKIITSIITFTKLIDNCYCFDILLTAENNFDLNNFLKINFKINKIQSVIPINFFNLDYNWLKKQFDIWKYTFIDYNIAFEECQKCRPYDVSLLKEKQDLDNCLKNSCNWLDSVMNLPKSGKLKNPYEEEKALLMNNLFLKEQSLRDVETEKKVYFSKICSHCIIFNEYMLKDEVFFTNFNQMMGIGVLKQSSNGYELDKTTLNCMTLCDIFASDNGCYTCYKECMRLFAALDLQKSLK